MMKRRDLFGLIAGLIATATGWTKPARATQTWADTAEKEFGQVVWVKGVYAYVGDVVTCENSHPICVFAATVCVGDLFDPAQLIGWTQKQPAIGTMEQPCEICGARWFKGPYFHFSDGWRIAEINRRFEAV